MSTGAGPSSRNKTTLTFDPGSLFASLGDNMKGAPGHCCLPVPILYKTGAICPTPAQASGSVKVAATG